jgi:hypothetical protein
MTGCQAPNNWERTELTKAPSTYAKRHFYRAVLEKLFFDKRIQFSSSERLVWGIRKGDLTSFLNFARRAMHSLGVDKDLISDDEIIVYESTYRDFEGKIAIMWTLSVMCCKIVESIIAMDRYWYLIEQGADQVDVVPIFDYKVSPRNLMMVASKGSRAIC